MHIYSQKFNVRFVCIYLQPNKLIPQHLCFNILEKYDTRTNGMFFFFSCCCFILLLRLSFVVPKYTNNMKIVESFVYLAPCTVHIHQFKMCVVIIIIVVVVIVEFSNFLENCCCFLPHCVCVCLCEILPALYVAHRAILTQAFIHASK